MISWPARAADEATIEAREIARLVRAFEESLDQADAIGTELKVAIRAARRRRGLSRVVGQPAEAAIGRALALNCQAAGESVAAHRLIDRLGAALGVDVRMFGDSSDDPSLDNTTGIAAETVAA